MSRLHSIKTATIVILLLVIIIGILIVWWQVNVSRRTNLENTLAQTVLTNPVKLSPFQFMDSSGPAFTNQSLQGRWAFLYFGYTDCGDICANAMNTLSQVYDQLKTQPQLVPLIIFISIKPHQDSLPKIQQYVISFNPNFLGLTADMTDLAKFTQALGSEYVKLKSPGIGKEIDGEQLAHTGTVFLIDPDGKLHAIFSQPYTTNSIINAYQNVLHHYGQPFNLTKAT